MDYNLLKTYKSEVEDELAQLLNWWMQFMVDEENGGFYGQADHHNLVNPLAQKGLVLNARILYTFSSAYLLNRQEDYLQMADRAFNYICTYFLDPKDGGFYWALNEKGEMLDGKKQVYGQAFAIYALAEYYKVSRNEQALILAIDTFQLLEKHSFDQLNLGYLEAFTKNWQPIDDLRLSEKDQNEKKTMNTHLHVIEAYANLYQIWKNEDLYAAIKNLLDNFYTHIINRETNHLQLFFSEEWKLRSNLVSFGHDIEAAWLLQEAAESIADPAAIARFRKLALLISEASMEGLAKNGGLWYEYDTLAKHWIREFHWWPQAEAMVGFFNAWQLNRKEQFLEASLQSWGFIKRYIKDQQNGEWHWGINNDYSLMEGQDKAGFWKCPYHNGRACIELSKRIATCLDQ